VKVGIVSLGCAKNQVDAEVMAGILEAAGHVVTADEYEAEVVVVNTCAFIREAKEESIDAILDVAQMKEAGKLRRLIVTGCMAQRYESELMHEIPEVDAYLGTGEFDRVAEVLAGLEKGMAGAGTHRVPEPVLVYSHETPRRRFTPAHWGYIKIADGCDNRCTYCVIPSVRGVLRSRPKSSVIAEARQMAAQGVREVCVIAQDTTAYGSDKKGGANITSLLQGLDKVRGIDWVRLMYAHPAHITDELLDYMAGSRKVVRYLDIPLQHIDDGMLKLMGRKVSGASVRKLIGRIRKKMPDAALRTSMMVGFPGETRDAFAELLRFVKEAEFDHLGVFRYSEEEGTPAASMERKVGEGLAQERYERLMKAQMKISEKKNKARVGHAYRVLVEGVSTETELLLEGRAYFQAPGIDGVVYINEGAARPGTFVDVEITEAHPYDLVGRVAG
jgi:ribosomal protein S12 methylthiotransferase